jgi:hypothetical protein
MAMGLKFVVISFKLMSESCFFTVAVNHRVNSVIPVRFDKPLIPRKLRLRSTPDLAHNELFSGGGGGVLK